MKGLLFSAVAVWAALAVVVTLIVFGSLLGFPAWNMEPRGDSAAVLVKEESVSLKEVSALAFSVSDYSLLVSAADGDRMTVRQRGRDTDEPFVLENDGGSVTVRQKQPWRFFWFSFSSVRRVLEIELPASYAADVRLETVSGDITLNDMFSCNEAVISSTSGDISFQREFRTQALRVKSVSGGIDAPWELSAKDSLRLNTTSGDLRLSVLTAPHMICGSTSGDLRVESASGRVEAGTSSGDVYFGSLTGQAELRSISGTIRTESWNGGGSVTSTSGDIRLRVCDPGTLTAESTSGDITILVPESSAFRFDASAVSGDISAFFPLSYDKNGKKAGADVNGGSGVFLSFKTVSGDIRVETLVAD